MAPVCRPEPWRRSRRLWAALALPQLELCHSGWFTEITGSPCLHAKWTFCLPTTQGHGKIKRRVQSCLQERKEDRSSTCSVSVSRGPNVCVCVRWVAWHGAEKTRTGSRIAYCILSSRLFRSPLVCDRLSGFSCLLMTLTILRRPSQVSYWMSLNLGLSDHFLTIMQLWVRPPWMWSALLIASHQRCKLNTTYRWWYWPWSPSQGSVC